MPSSCQLTLDSQHPSVPFCLWYSPFHGLLSCSRIAATTFPLLNPPLFPTRYSLWLWAQIVQELLRFLHRLASAHKDYAVVLCCLGAKEALSKVLDKHSASVLLACELRDLLTDCEKHAQLYSSLTSSILAGCIQVGRWVGTERREMEGRTRGRGFSVSPFGVSV